MQDSNSLDKLGEIFLQVVDRFNEMEKIPYFTGSDAVLHLSEVHLIEAIGKHEDINVTKLADLQGVSKSAISQMIRKLVKKGFVRKNISSEAENEVVLKLTEKGSDIFECHRQYHKRLNHELAAICNEMPTGMVGHLEELGIGMDKVFSKIIEEREKSLQGKTP